MVRRAMLNEPNPCDEHPIPARSPSLLLGGMKVGSLDTSAHIKG